MSGKSNGAGFFKIPNPNDKQTIERYRQAVAEALAQFENAVKLAVRAKDRVGLESIKAEVLEVIQRADATLNRESST